MGEGVEGYIFLEASHTFCPRGRQKAAPGMDSDVAHSPDFLWKATTRGSKGQVLKPVETEGTRRKTRGLEAAS